MAVAIVGAPASESDRIAGSKMFELGLLYLGRQDWAQAEDAFKKSVRLDGSLATYHAKLGEVEMVLGHWEEAGAEYTAASLIDVDNQEYRARIKEARSRKG
jgi:Tfp pilus assembly protein PilF